MKNVFSRNGFLDIIKAFCIVFVIITHDAISDSFRLKALFPFWINMAVPVFMIISGYVYAISFEKNNISEIQQAYSPRFLVPKIIRYTVPFVMAFAVEVIGDYIAYKLGVGNFSIKRWVKLFFEGGKGPGSYYYPLMLQFLLFYPLVYFIVKKYDFRGVLLCLLINACFEFFKQMWHCNGEFYRLLLFRYTLVIAFGSWLYQRKKEKNQFLWKSVSFFIGLAFIILYCYIGIKPTIIVYWTSTCFLACLYVLPIAGFLIRKVHITFKPIEFIGRASFNIFLVQMVYFEYAAGVMRIIIPSHFLWLCAHIGICLIAGLLFYWVEQKITKCILQKYKSAQ